MRIYDIQCIAEYGIPVSHGRTLPGTGPTIAVWLTAQENFPISAIYLCIFVNTMERLSMAQQRTMQNYAEH